MGDRSIGLAITAACLALGGCAGIEDAGVRMGRAADSLGDGEAATTLTNVVRSGRSLPLEFFAPGTYTATRSTTLGIGLPTVTIGPHQTSAQQQVVFGGNLISSAVGYSATSAPIVTQEFTNALLTQATVATLGAYVDQGFSREMLFSLFVDAIEVSQTIDGQVYSELLHNDPTTDAAAGCPDEGDYNPAVVAVDVRAWYRRTEQIRADPTLSYDQKQAAILSAGRARAATRAGCQFHRLRFYVSLALDAGLGVRRDEGPPPPPGEKPTLDKPPVAASAPADLAAADAKSPPSPRVLGRFCFSRALAKDSFYGNLRPNQYPNLQGCEGPLKAQSSLSIKLSDGRGGDVEQQFSLRLRSPMQMFRYLGALSADRRAAAAAGFTIEARSGSDCGVTAKVQRRSYCVPERARSTLEAITVLNLLVRQSTKRDDVPKSVTLTL